MASAAAIDMDQNSALSCVLIPTSQESLLLPNVCIAEIVPWRRIKPADNAPSWCLGHVGWRGSSLAVIDFAALNEQAHDAPTPRCLVVMNRARSSSGPAFYAIAAQALPRMLQIAEEDVTGQEASLGPADVMKVQVGTEVATIPDLEFLENSIAQFA